MRDLKLYFAPRQDTASQNRPPEKGTARQNRGEGPGDQGGKTYVGHKKTQTLADAGADPRQHGADDLRYRAAAGACTRPRAEPRGASAARPAFPHTDELL